MTGPGSLLLSVLMLAAGALLVGAWVLWRRTRQPKQPVLMLICAAVLIGNVLIWTV